MAGGDSFAAHVSDGLATTHLTLRSDLWFDGGYRSRTQPKHESAHINRKAEIAFELIKLKMALKGY
jgi:hypothetical protein